MMRLLLTPFSWLGAAAAARRQRASVLRDPAHWGAAVSDAGRLEADGVDLAALVGREGSPLIAVSRRRLREDAQAVLDAVGTALPDAMVAYSYKTNCVPGVLSELHAAGFAAEVISPYELWLARRLGVPGERIVVNGVNKPYGYIEEAVRAGVFSINVDDAAELGLIRKAAAALGRRARVSLRLKLDRRSHFGLRLETGEAASAAHEVAATPGQLELVGLHFHALADSHDPRPHIGYMTKALSFARQIRREHGLATPTLNVGGGYAVPTVNVMSRYEYARQRLLDMPADPPDPSTGTAFPEYVARLAEALENWCASHSFPMPRLVLEPGRLVTSRSHVLLTAVHAIKSAASLPDFAMTDAGKILTYPCDYEYHQMFVANKMRRAWNARYHLMGRLCTGADWLAKNRCLPRLEPGDVVAVMDAGAYFTSHASNFAFPRPAVVLLDEGEVRVLRRQETYEHLTAMDEPEERRAKRLEGVGTLAAAE